MLNKEFKRRLAYEVLIFLGLMALLLLLTRLWPLLLLLILGIFTAALRLLFRRADRVEVIMPAMLPVPDPKPDTEKDILRLAFGLIQRRITEEVESLHPSARWHWLTPNALASIEKDEPVAIILNGAGGYRKATVSIRNLAFKGLVFETVTNEESNHAQPQENPMPDPDEDESFDYGAEPEENEKSGQDEPVNYAYLAFEWVDSRLLQLNERANEAIGRGQKTLLIPEAELPNKDSWPDICKRLMNSDFADAVAMANGIQVSIQQ